MAPSTRPLKALLLSTKSIRTKRNKKGIPQGMSFLLSFEKDKSALRILGSILKREIS